MKNNAINEQYTKIELFGQSVLFTESRLDKQTLPSEVHSYEIRHGQNDWYTPVALEPTVVEDFFGTVICNDPIPLDTHQQRTISGEQDFSFGDANIIHLAEYTSTT